jgi:hypothetical protein
MNKFYFTLVLILSVFITKATTYTVNINGLSYSQSTLTVYIGDVITIQANSSHPLIEVDQATWTAG